MCMRAAWLRHAAVLLLALSVWWVGSVASARAGSLDVDLHLVLAVDASGSVNETRFELQRQGYVQAFRHPSVLKAIRSGPHQAIAVTMFQWTGPTLQVQLMPWFRIDDESSMHSFAGVIDSTPRQLFGGGTSISGAIDYSMQLFKVSPFKGGRKVIDVSGDGANNRGRPASDARHAAIAAGAIINGLPILELDPTLDQHYWDNVVGGPNAFMVPAARFDEFADAIRKKLIIEIAEQPPAVLPLRPPIRKACSQC